MANIVLVLFALLVSTTSAQISFTPGQQCQHEDTSILGVRITDGIDVTALEAPWNVVMEIKKNKNEDSITTHCGGSIISKTAILTAAHCLWHNKHSCPAEERNQNSATECHEFPDGTPRSCPSACLRVRPQDINVYMGITSISQSNRTPLKVKTIVLHENWNKRTFLNESLYIGHDLALVRLQNELEFNNQTIQSICVPNYLLQPGGNVSLFGFGYVETNPYVIEYNKPAKQLQKGHLRIIAKENCVANYTRVHGKEIEGDQLCAISAGPNSTDACRGDSGGGLVMSVNGFHVLVGVVSFGSRKCNGDSPGVYTNVQSHMTWIRLKLSNIAACQVDDEIFGDACMCGPQRCFPGNRCIRGTSCTPPGPLLLQKHALETCPGNRCQRGNKCCRFYFTPKGYQCPNSC